MVKTSFNQLPLFFPDLSDAAVVLSQILEVHPMRIGKAKISLLFNATSVHLTAPIHLPELTYLRGESWVGKQQANSLDPATTKGTLGLSLCLPKFHLAPCQLLLC